MKTRRCPSFSRRFVRQMSCVAGESMKNRWAGKEAALGATRQTAAPSVIDLLNWEQRVACVSCGAPGTDRKKKCFIVFFLNDEHVRLAEDWRWICGRWANFSHWKRRKWKWRESDGRPVTDMTALSSADEPKRFETINFCVVSRWRRLFHVLEIEEKKESNNKAEASATWVCREICPLVDEINLETFFFPCYPDWPILLRNIGVYGRRVSIFTSCITAAYLSCVLS